MRRRDRAVGPEIDQRVDVVVERIRGNAEDVVKQNVGVKRADEKPGGGAMIADANRPGIDGTFEILLHDADSTPRRRVFGLRIEWNDQRRVLRVAVHLDGERHRDHAANERDELRRHAPEHDARVVSGIGGRQSGDARRQFDRTIQHRLGEQCTLAGKVTEDRRGSDPHAGGDLREGRRLEALRGKTGAGALEKACPIDGRRPAHL